MDTHTNSGGSPNVDALPASTATLAGEAPPGAPPTAPNPLLLPGMTRRAALAECAVLLLWFLAKHRFLSWWTRRFSLDVDPDFMHALVVPYLIIAGATVALGTLLLRLRKLPPDALGLSRDRLETQLLWALGAALVVYGVSSGLAHLITSVQSWLYRVGHTPLSWLRHSDPLADVTSEATVGTVLLLLAAGAVYEEVLYRGLLFTRLRRVTGRWWAAVLATSLLFGATHLGSGPANALAAFLGSLVWCVTFIRSRSLLAVTVGHFLYNSGLYALYCWRLAAP